MSVVWQAWDDVQRKVKPPEKPYNYQRARPLNQEKSKHSLAEIYAEDYINQTEVCVCVCVHARTCACMCARVHACVCVGGRRTV